MLKTERAYRDALKAIRVLEHEEIPAERTRWLKKGASEEALKPLIAPLRARVARLRHDVAVYERVRQGDLSMFEDIEDVGQVLVAARLARGWSQRELAARLQVHESQVSRDERYEYQGITVERLQGLCDVLGLDLDTVPRLRGATRELRTAAAPSIPPEANPPSSGTPAIPHVRRTPGWSPAVPAPAAGGQSRSAGWSQTNLPTAPHAGRRWLSAPQLSRLAAAPKGEAGSTANDEPEGESAVAASLPRLGVFFMTGSPTAGATGGATGPLGPFVYQSQSYASAQSHDYAARANSYAAESEECAAARRDIAA